jgi:hypothetical protein
MGIGGEEGIVRGAEQAPVVPIGQRRRWRVRLEWVAVSRLARHAHGSAVGQRMLGIAGAEASPGEFGNVIRHEVKAGTRAGRKPGRTFGARGARNAFKPRKQLVEDVRRLMQPLPVELQVSRRRYGERLSTWWSRESPRLRMSIQRLLMVQGYGGRCSARSSIYTCPAVPAASLMCWSTWGHRAAACGRHRLSKTRDAKLSRVHESHWRTRDHTDDAIAWRIRIQLFHQC